LLIKFLFTTDNLSVQVHPNDEQAQRTGKPRGKTEMWHILRAEPGARIALGLKRPVTAEELRQSALDGSIVELLNWIPVQAGQTFFTPAGTIHAIGAGIALCEIQQYSDITYRLYDWGRGRELHLDAGVDVSLLEPAGEAAVSFPVRCPYFLTECLEVRGDGERLSCKSATVIGIRGEASINGKPFREGDVLRVQDEEYTHLRGTDATVLVTLP
jgi:mannose-6-phosphate isomerase